LMWKLESSKWHRRKKWQAYVKECLSRSVCQGM
jgi:hypothetical protein